MNLCFVSLLFLTTPLTFAKKSEDIFDIDTLKKDSEIVTRVSRLVRRYSRLSKADEADLHSSSSQQPSDIVKKAVADFPLVPGPPRDPNLPRLKISKYDIENDTTCTGSVAVPWQRDSANGSTGMHRFTLQGYLQDPDSWTLTIDEKKCGLLCATLPFPSIEYTQCIGSKTDLARFKLAQTSNLAKRALTFGAPLYHNMVEDINKEIIRLHKKHINEEIIGEESENPAPVRVNPPIEEEAKKLVDEDYEKKLPNHILDFNEIMDTALAKPIEMAAQGLAWKRIEAHKIQRMKMEYNRLIDAEMLAKANTKKEEEEKRNVEQEAEMNGKEQEALDRAREKAQLEKLEQEDIIKEQEKLFVGEDRGDDKQVNNEPPSLELRFRAMNNTVTAAKTETKILRNVKNKETSQPQWSDNFILMSARVYSDAEIKDMLQETYRIAKQYLRKIFVDSFRAGKFLPGDKSARLAMENRARRDHDVWCIRHKIPLFSKTPLSKILEQWLGPVDHPIDPISRYKVSNVKEFLREWLDDNIYNPEVSLNYLKITDGSDGNYASMPSLRGRGGNSDVTMRQILMESDSGIPEPQSDASKMFESNISLIDEPTTLEEALVIEKENEVNAVGVQEQELVEEISVEEATEEELALFDAAFDELPASLKIASSYLHQNIHAEGKNDEIKVLQERLGLTGMLLVGEAKRQEKRILKNLFFCNNLGEKDDGIHFLSCDAIYRVVRKLLSDTSKVYPVLVERVRHSHEKMQIAAEKAAKAVLKLSNAYREIVIEKEIQDSIHVNLEENANLFERWSDEEEGQEKTEEGGRGEAQDSSSEENAGETGEESNGDGVEDDSKKKEKHEYNEISQGRVEKREEGLSMKRQKIAETLLEKASKESEEAAVELDEAMNEVRRLSPSLTITQSKMKYLVRAYIETKAKRDPGKLVKSPELIAAEKKLEEAKLRSKKKFDTDEKHKRDVVKFRKEKEEEAYRLHVENRKFEAQIEEIEQQHIRAVANLKSAEKAAKEELEAREEIDRKMEALEKELEEKQSKLKEEEAEEQKLAAIQDEVETRIRNANLKAEKEKLHAQNILNGIEERRKKSMDDAAKQIQQAELKAEQIEEDYKQRAKALAAEEVEAEERANAAREKAEKAEREVDEALESLHSSEANLRQIANEEITTQKQVSSDTGNDAESVAIMEKLQAETEEAEKMERDAREALQIAERKRDQLRLQAQPRTDVFEKRKKNLEEENKTDLEKAQKNVAEMKKQADQLAKEAAINVKRLKSEAENSERAANTAEKESREAADELERIKERKSELERNLTVLQGELAASKSNIQNGNMSQLEEDVVTAQNLVEKEKAQIEMIETRMKNAEAELEQHKKENENWLEQVKIESKKLDERGVDLGNQLMEREYDG
eukprot:g1604.t1